MSDILDIIIDSLPPSTLRMIMDFESEHIKHSADVSRSLHDTQQIKLRQVKELRRKIFDIETKTAENRKCISKLKTELEAVKSLKKPEGNQSSIKAYMAKISELEAQTKTLTKNHGEIDLASFLNTTEELYKEIEEYKKKIAEAKSKYECYGDFPPDIEQGKAAIARIKEKIKQNEAALESFP